MTRILQFINKCKFQFLSLFIVLFGLAAGQQAKGQTYILNDNFGGGTFGSSQSSPSSTAWTAAGSWTTNGKAYQAGTEGAGSYNVLKLSTSSNAGTITTTALNLSVNGGSFSVSFDYLGYSTSELYPITVQLNSGTAQTATTPTSLQVPGGTFGSATLNFTGGTSSSTLTFAVGSGKRAFISNVRVYYNSSINYYWNGTGKLDQVASWGQNSNGSGTQPNDFVTAGQIFNITSANSTTFNGNTWTVSGSSSKIVVANTANLNVPNTVTLTSTVDVSSGGTLTMNNAPVTGLTLGTIDPASTINYSGYSALALTGTNLATTTYGTLTFTNTTVTDPASIITFAGNFNLSGTSVFNCPLSSLYTTGTQAQTITGNNSAANFVILNLQNGYTPTARTSGSLTLAANTPITIANTLRMYLSGATFNDGGNSLSVGNNLELDGTTANYTLTGSITLNGISGTQKICNNKTSNAAIVASLSNLIINTTGAGNTAFYPSGGASTITLTGSLTIAATNIGALALNGNTINIGGNLNYNSTTASLLTTTSSTVNFNSSTAAQSISYSPSSGALAFATLTLNNTFSSNPTITVAGSVSASTINFTAKNLSISGGKTLTGALTVATGNTLTGTGSAASAVSIAGTISPAGSGTVGTLNTGALTFSSGGAYALDITKLPANGSAGTDWDNIVSSGALATPGSGSNFTVKIAGTIASFINTTSYQWQIGTFSGSAPSNTFMAVDASGITNTLNGTFTITFATNAMYLNYTPTLTAPPALTAASGATVDAAFTVTFPDNSAWRSAITGITVGGTALTGGYSVSAGHISFTPSASVPAGLLQTSGTTSIVVSATGYNAATVSQSIGAGAATKLIITTQPTAPATNGAVLAQVPVVSIQDQYGNATTSTASITATATGGAWTIGGVTNPLPAVSGVATFTGMTATSAAAVGAATITFTSGSLTQAVSTPTFAIPAPLKFTPGNIAVLVAAASATNTTASIIELNNSTASQTSPVNTYSVSGTGTNAIRISGSATSTCYLANSNDGTLLAFTGVNNIDGTTNANALNPRAVCTLTPSYNFNIATTYTGASGNQTRGASTVDNSAWFIGDQNGLYTNSGTSASVGTNLRSIKSFGGTVYGFTSVTTSPYVGILSSPTATTFSALTGLPNGSTSGQDFYLISSGSNGNTYDVLYILTSTTILKYSLVSASWTANGSYTLAGGGFGLAAQASSGGANIYLSTGTGATTANSVIKLFDIAGYNATINITTANNVTLYTAPAGTILKGVAFAPALASTVTVSGTGPYSYTYNGSAQTPAFTKTGSTASLTYAYTGTGSTTYNSSTAPTNVGTYSVTASVAADANYNGISSSATAFSITAATPTISVSGTQTFTYNGSAQGPSTVSYNGDGTTSLLYTNVGGTSYSSSTKPTNAGNYQVVASATAGTNYSAASSGAYTFTINQATPTISVSGTQTFTYNGSAQGPSTVSYNGDGTTSLLYTNVGGTSYSSSTKPTNAGNYQVVASATAGTNYSAASSGAYTFTINQATPTLSITGTPTSFTYTGSAQGPTVTVTNNSGGAQTFSYTSTDGGGYSSATPPTNAGAYQVTVSAGATSNYTAAGPSNAVAFTIGKVALTIAAGSQSVVYGTAPSTVTGAGTYTPSGFVNGENSTVITGTATYTTTYTATTAVGASGITITPVVTGLSATNYSFTPANGTITVTGLSQATADYRTRASGNFDGSAVWQYDAGGGAWTNTTVPPTSTNSITILHAVTLNQDFTNGSGTGFTIGTGGSLTIAANKTLTVAGTADFGNNPVVVQSTATGTGTIGTITGTLTGATAVTVQRYIPVNTASPRTGRAWRLVTAPVTGTTINAAWQEGQVYPANSSSAPGYGTLITGYRQETAATANANGYDFWSQIANSSSSIQRYVGGTPYGTYQNLDVNPLTKQLSSEQGYLLYIRGDRSSADTVTAGSTTLRATGELTNDETPATPVSVAVSGGGTANATLVGDPYASAINFESIYTNTNNSSLIQPYFWQWDANLGTIGGYVLVQRNGANSYTTVPSIYTPANPQYIQSGESFWVSPLTTASGSLNIQESDKVSGNNNNNLLLTPQQAGDKADAAATLKANATLGINLYLLNSDSTVLGADGALAEFSKNTAKVIAGQAIAKNYNIAENLSLYKGTSYLIVGGYTAPKAGDTVHLALWHTAQRSYQFQVRAGGLKSNFTGLKAYLSDAYLGTLTPLSLTGTTKISFSVTSVAASQSISRFCIVFAAATKTTTDATNPSAKTNGSSLGSSTAVKVYPDPVQGSSVTVTVSNLAAGAYEIGLYSPTGTKLLVQKVNHTGGDMTQAISIPAGWSNGLYTVRVTDSRGGVKSVSAVVARY